ncbi:MAG: endolytic transglycosylase MltG [Proteobacteria bacterium]|jgi:UPF0755 protein|nr:endolytic transglycosylase MltG [Pseudomonadota bacterium]
MHGIKKYIILLIIGSVAFAALFFYLGYREFHQPNEMETESVFLVPAGQGLIRTARLLDEQKLISDREIFKIGVMLSGKERTLKAGEFLIPAAASMKDILDILVAGTVIQHQLTIVEGWTSVQIFDYLNAIDNLSEPLTDLPAEGSVLPESYKYTYGTSRLDILKRMQQNQKIMLDDLWDNRAANLPIKTMDEAVTLASIVERETGIAAERPHIAGVFINRLNRKIRLQSDPTIIYGIDRKGYIDRPLRRSQIENKENLYNTYQIDGLPPTPIAHPGIASLEAVLKPMATNDIFFVADGTGGHVFAETLDQHKKNVAAWRKIENGRK